VHFSAFWQMYTQRKVSHVNEVSKCVRTGRKVCRV
jgi:hypothetical protein